MKISKQGRNGRDVDEAERAGAPEVHGRHEAPLGGVKVAAQGASGLSYAGDAPMSKGQQLADVVQAHA